MSLFSGDDDSAIVSYISLTKMSIEWQSFSCRHLCNYIRDTLHYWHNSIKDKLSK